MVSLAERPGTGYEIAQQFDRSIGHFWSATHQQVYRTLKKLHADGLVDFEPVVQDGRPDKKVYQLSGLGRERLATWVSTPTPVTPFATKSVSRSAGPSTAISARSSSRSSNTGRRAAGSSGSTTDSPSKTIPTPTR